MPATVQSGYRNAEKGHLRFAGGVPGAGTAPKHTAEAGPTHMALIHRIQDAHNGLKGDRLTLGSQ